MSTDNRRVDLVFEGGGVKGLALAGAFAELDSQGFQHQCVAGTSAGAITAALVAAGYTGQEIEHIVKDEMSFPSFEDPPHLHELGPLGDAIDVVRRKGIHSGAYFVSWIQQMLEAKGVTKFGDLKDSATTDERRRYRLQVIASDVSTTTMLVLPRDASQLGVDPDQLKVADAVRMSMSIPIFFEPVIVQNPKDGGQHMIVDGGLLSNFPVWLFDVTDRTPEFPTFGLQLVAPARQGPAATGDGSPPTIPGFIDFVKSIAETAIGGHDRFDLEDQDYERTISISTLGVSTIDFGIQPDRVQALIDSGHDAAKKFLAAWSFEAWLAKYRGSTQPAPPSAGPHT
jgi:NTE family protein